MLTVRADHFSTYIRTSHIDSYLAEYRNAGFSVAEQTVRHDPGLRNGFVLLGPEYLEFSWVEDEAAFAQGHPAHAMLRQALRPWSIGLVTDDAQALHQAWTAR